MKSQEIRQMYLEFFREKGHKIVPSAPIVVKDDPTLMFTNAGMNQFKDYFLGNHPLWQVFRVSFQMMKKPYVVGGLVLLSGYFYSFASRMERPVAAELLKFHRQEQLERLKHLLLSFLRTGRFRLQR